MINKKKSIWEEHPELVRLLFEFYPMYGSRTWDRLPIFKKNKVSVEALSKKAERLRIRFDPELNQKQSEESLVEFFKGKRYVCSLGHTVDVRTGRCLEGNHPAFIDTKTAKIGVFDIEAGNLDADWGFVYSWALKTLGKNEIRTGRITREDLDKRIFDKRILLELTKALREYDAIITYYGTGFDFPYVRTRCYFHKIPFFAHGTLLNWDMYYVVRNKLKLSRNRLDNVAAVLGIRGKTHLDSKIWTYASLGDEKSMDYIVNHNIKDVIVLEKVYKRLIGSWAPNKKSI